MGKSVYSVVLLDEVVSKIDKLAYKTGSSRSNIINQILAEYVSYVTPEAQRRQIYAAIDAALENDENFKKTGPAESAVAYFSSLPYKYNPSVRYTVEIYEIGDYIRGEIRAGLRSQSSSLLYNFAEFFSRWSALEQGRSSRHKSAFANGRFLRPFVFENTGESEAVGKSLAEYIQTVDRSMKEYFRYLDNTNAAYRRMESILNDFIMAVESESWFLKG
ncbi:MAG: ribbon-helix-helix protein, CopG family [Oscillospiraceae bacterium]|nr:ribbon-helix-helix protein, CopG family [Oscillospiraceae bacterium]